MKDSIKYVGSVRYENGQEFVEKLNSHIGQAEMSGCKVEIQYSPVIQLNGKVLLTALVIGRER
ncbi:MAG TPA: hypothetical protein VK190_04815 [Pseudoneobacillus sp.]|nr:hypothetical protein [Pseudoneobacillus sp.]